MSYLTESGTIPIMKLTAHTITNHVAEDDRTRVTLLKGVAIAAVVIIHILSSIPGYIYTTTNAAQYIFLDQLLRFSVPLFIGLSGYSLARRYQDIVEYVPFYKRRLLRIIPLYLLWSISLWFVFNYIPEWNTYESPVPFWKVILLGRADYHLYFVPLIFQLYLLFPFLLNILKKYPRTVLFGALTLQSTSYIAFNYVDTLSSKALFDSDQTQYSLLFSWIFYFVLGMFIAKRKLKQQDKTKTISFIWLAWGLSLAYLALQGQLQIFNGIDPLDALKFTRLPVLPYALSSICLALLVPWETFSHPTWLTKILHTIGIFSFTIFLSHTIVLRLLFSFTYESLSISAMLLTTVVSAVAIIASYLYEKTP